jgi:hypothetical protein
MTGGNLSGSFNLKASAMPASADAQSKALSSETGLELVCPFTSPVVASTSTNAPANRPHTDATAEEKRMSKIQVDDTPELMGKIDPLKMTNLVRMSQG